MQQEFWEIYECLFDDIYRYIYLRAGTKWDAEDLVSEVFRKGFEGYSSRIKNPKAWLFRIAKNTVADFYRKNRAAPLGYGGFEIKTDGPGFEKNLEADEELRTLKSLLFELDEKDRDYLYLHYFASLTYKDMGKMFRRTEGSIKMKVMRARNKLSALMKEKVE